MQGMYWMPLRGSRLACRLGRFLWTSNSWHTWRPCRVGSCRLPVCNLEESSRCKICQQPDSGQACRHRRLASRRMLEVYRSSSLWGTLGTLWSEGWLLAWVDMRANSFAGRLLGKGLAGRRSRWLVSCKSGNRRGRNGKSWPACPGRNSDSSCNPLAACT